MACALNPDNDINQYYKLVAAPYSAILQEREKTEVCKQTIGTYTSNLFNN